MRRAGLPVSTPSPAPDVVVTDDPVDLTQRGEPLIERGVGGPGRQGTGWGGAQEWIAVLPQEGIPELRGSGMLELRPAGRR